CSGGMPAQRSFGGGCRHGLPDTSSWLQGYNSFFCVFFQSTLKKSQKIPIITCDSSKRLGRKTNRDSG
ncbi:MAG: hypothetical protein IKR13_04540, partial [Victivallales bacterium]|nr:hypothetical protein [Victivallales bacterium]